MLTIVALALSAIPEAPLTTTTILSAAWLISFYKTSFKFILLLTINSMSILFKTPLHGIDNLIAPHSLVYPTTAWMTTQEERNSSNANATSKADEHIMAKEVRMRTVGGFSQDRQ